MKCSARQGAVATEEERMFKTIVLALDGSEGSEKAIPVAAELARQDGARIVVAHVEQDIPGRARGPIIATEDEIQAEIRKRAEELAADGLEASVEVRIVTVGGPAYAIAEIADEAGAGLIVAGSHGHTALGGFLLGSVTQRLLNVTNCPVLVVPSRDRT
jgi:nucleotide-binding universal stress UspA family protein